MKPAKFKTSDLILTPTLAVVQCWGCKYEFPLFEELHGSRLFILRGKSAWIFHSAQRVCPLCGGELWRYDSAEKLAESKSRTREREVVEQSEAERLHAENAGLSVRLRDALQQITYLQAELRRAEGMRADALLELDDLRQQAFPLKEQQGATCPQCGARFYQEATGRRARFCSALCRLHFHRETKRNARNVSTQEGEA